MKRFVSVIVAAVTIAAQTQTRTLQEIATDIERLAGEIRALVPVPEPDVTQPIQVAATANLQDAINAAPPGAVLELPAGAIYTWNFVVAKSLTVRTAGPGFTGRATRDHIPQMAQLVSGNPGTVIDILPGVQNVRFERVRIGPAAVLTDDIVKIGHGDSTQNTLELQPRTVVFDQVLIEGDPTRGAKRGVSAHGVGISITRSSILGIWLDTSQDSSGIGIWNGEGPYVIDDNTIQAASEGVLVGGSDPRIPGIMPSDIAITNNHITKDPAWRGLRRSIKNAVEFKAGRRITVRRNLIEHVWAGEGQSGYHLVITPSQYGTNPSVTVEDLLFEHNVVRNVSSGINLLGFGQNQSTRPTAVSTRITIRNNWFQLDHRTWGGNGWFLQLGNGPRDVVIENNTIETLGNQFIQGNAGGDLPTGFRFVGNLVHTIGAYGTYLRVDGAWHLRGSRWADYFPGGLMQGNGFVGDVSQFRTNVPNNFHSSTAASAGLVVDGYGTGVLEPYGRRRD